MHLPAAPVPWMGGLGCLSEGENDGLTFVDGMRVDGVVGRKVGSWVGRFFLPLEAVAAALSVGLMDEGCPNH